MSERHDAEVRTVQVEFIRPGPPHNQLLSPLTRYLAVCGESRVGEVSVPFEHSEFIRRLRDLRYLGEFGPLDGAGDEQALARQLERQNEDNRDRQAALMELSKQMSQLLSAVPGLSAQVSARQCGAELVHLQFVITAAELAMLPFELAGTLEQPGSDPGSYLQLGAKPLISMTRRARGVKDSCVKWPSHPKILFVSADPGPPVPYAEHVDALVRSLQPWLPPLDVSSYDEPARNAAYDKSVSAHLTILKRASISQIAERCATEKFTHVHVLAHGASDPNSPGRHYGLALHSDHDKSHTHVVSGAQFASALRRDGGEPGPAIVTLAACDSGNVHDVMYTGASFAHELHRSGIPFVVASQFPLSIAGSRILTEHLYRGLLLGQDPRELLCDVRLRLHSVYAGVAHDWASLVTYAAFPPDLPEQLEEVSYYRARKALDVALDSLDIELTGMTRTDKSGDAVSPRGPADPQKRPDTREMADQIRERLFSRLDAAMKLLPTSGKYVVEGLGLLAAAEKRRSEFCFAVCRRHPEMKTEKLENEAIQRLRRSMDTYDKAFREGVACPIRATHTGPLHWAITQQLSLQAVLDSEFEADRWATASELAKIDLVGTSATWARTSLLELSLLRWWILGKNESASMDAHLNELFELTRENKFPLHSTERQLRRYLDWWWTGEFRAQGGATKPEPPELRQKVLEIAARISAQRGRGPLAP